jgi:hypothetical protein
MDVTWTLRILGEPRVTIPSSESDRRLDCAADNSDAASVAPSAGLFQSSV